MYNRSKMTEVISLVIFTLSLVEFSQALISCNETYVTKSQCLKTENDPDILIYPDIIKVRNPLKIKTALMLISIAEVVYHKISKNDKTLKFLMKSPRLFSNKQNSY